MERWDKAKIGLLAFVLIVFLMRFTPIMRGLFIVFLASLFALFLSGLGKRLSERIGLPEKAWVLVILVFIVAVMAGVIAFSGKSIAYQFDALGAQIAPAISQAEGFLLQYGWGQQVLNVVGQVEFAQVAPQLQDFAQAAIDLFIAGVVILVGGIFIAMEPKSYKKGLEWLAPEGHVKKYEQVLSSLVSRLYRWTIGRLASMVVVFVLTLVGLLILGAPLAALLALIAGLLSFIPNFGPIFSAVLAALVGLSVSPALALYILILFVAVQLLESNFITPLIERQASYLPAGAILVFQALMGFSFGILGLMVSTPVAVAIVTVLKGVREQPVG